MKKALRFSSPIFLIALIALFSVFFVSMKARATKKPSPKPYKITAMDQEQKLQKFNLTGFDEKGQKFWNLEGKTAKIDVGQTVFLEDEVTLRLKDNTIIETEKVEWTQETGVMNTKAPVLVKRDGTRVNGQGAYGRLNESFIQLNRNIEMVLETGAKLTCLGPMKIFYSQNKMTFYRRVMVRDAKGTLTSNRMDVLFDEDRKAKEIVATGQVVIKREGDTTLSERAIYSVVTGSIRLEGKPEITFHKSTDLVNGPLTN